MPPRLNPEPLKEKIRLVDRALHSIDGRAPPRRPRLINDQRPRARGLDDKLDLSPASVEELSGAVATGAPLPAPIIFSAAEEGHWGPIHLKDRSLSDLSPAEPYARSASVRGELTTIAPVRVGRARDAVTAALKRMKKSPRTAPEASSPSARVEVNPRRREELWVALGVSLEALIAGADHRTVAPKEL